MSLQDYFNNLDNVTKIHCNNIVKIAIVFCKHIRLTKQLSKHVIETAMYHDIGKIKVPIEILNKPGKLNTFEYNTVKKHPVYGYVIYLKNVETLKYSRSVAKGILEHHEHWDGSGYPSGKKGLEISLVARIILVLDVYDSLVTERPYKRAWSHDEAMSYLMDNVNKLFDGEIIMHFMSIHDKIVEVYS